MFFSSESVLSSYQLRLLGDNFVSVLTTIDSGFHVSVSHFVFLSVLVSWRELISLVSRACGPGAAVEHWTMAPTTSPGKKGDSPGSPSRKKEKKPGITKKIRCQGSGNDAAHD